MTSNGTNGVVHHGTVVELREERFTPKGWPGEVIVREMTAGQVLDMYHVGVELSGDILQMTMLVNCAYDAMTGERLFMSVEQVRNLPARMLAGLMQMFQSNARMNVLELPTEDARPTLPLSG